MTTVGPGLAVTPLVEGVRVTGIVSAVSAVRSRRSGMLIVLRAPEALPLANVTVPVTGV
jgi:hypothetical protein